ncbi:MAG TPA: helicase-related protein, partial [Gemmatimonadaceae bacterium]|nr:helicase-related protein [Gemmatimonadaceae bacterium]
SVGDDVRTVRALIALPPPVPPRDGGDGGALLHWSLVRQWASSRGALLGALRRRLARAAALAAALEAGRHPSRAELAAWCGADGAVQLAFTELLVPPTHDPAPLLHALRAHEQALRALLHRLERAADIDDTRALRLRELRARHAGERIVAFTQYADTALALFRRLRAAPGVAVLTARGALVAGGALSRAEALRRFAPTASNAPEPRATERITFLIATDLLSEGVDLRDASVVVHLDLPWTPARMEQRVGRSRRLGAAHARTAVYALAPPARAEMLLGVERRLRAKLGAAARVLGIAGAILPPLASARTDDAPPPVRAEEHLRAALAAWLPAGEPAPRRGARADDAIPLAGPAGPQRERAVAAAAARAAAAGALVLARDGARPVLLLVRGGRVSPQPAALAEAVLAAGGDDVPVDAERALVALRAAERWLARRVCERDAGLELSLVADARRRALRRIAAITARAPRHHRALVARLAGRARHAVTARYGTGPERVLAELAAAPMPDDAWLRAVGAFGELHAAPAPAAEEGPAPEVLAVLLLVPPPPGDDAATPPGAASFPPPPRAG